MGSVSPGCMKRSLSYIILISEITSKMATDIHTKVTKAIFVTPNLICCSGERGTGERKRGYQAGFSEQVIDLSVLKLKNFNSYIHFIFSIFFNLIYISICSLPLLKLKLPYKPSSGTKQVAGKSVNV